ncbi:MAG: undecaprenyl-diphosphate phosphatase [Ruminococcaceae bacterium]|nr:undecaprenyl-diphosphate phosphatase [Oscillospiraceae bacterium]
MNWLEAIILGLVQGLCEFLPISSSGHLAVFQSFFGMEGEENLILSILLHLGTLIAVIAVYYKDIWMIIKNFFLMLGDIFKKRFTWKDANQYQRMAVLMMVTLIPLVLVLLFKDFVEWITAIPWAIGVLLILNGIILYISTKFEDTDKDISKATPKNALTIGFIQLLGVLPGISRSGSTISGALYCGFDRELAVKYSFILSIPTIVAANLLNIFDIAKMSITGEQAAMYAVGMLVAAVSGFFAIKLLNMLMKRNLFKIFAIYSVIAGAATAVASFFIG